MFVKSVSFLAASIKSITPMQKYPQITESFACTRKMLAFMFLFPINSLKVHSQVWDNFWQLKALQKQWKMLFISPQKLFSFSKYFSFCLDLFVIYRNGLIEKIRLISNFMTSQPG